MNSTGHKLQFQWTGSDLQFYVDNSGPFFSTANFQDGVDTLYNKCVSCGWTPTGKTPTAISDAIQGIYGNRYTEGYNNGRTQGQNDVKGNPNAYGLYTQQQYDQNYTNGYNAGVSAGQGSVAGSYNISFTINARGGNNGSNWMKYTDQITINVSKSGVPTLGSPSFMNAQIRSEYGESYRLTKK